MIYTGLLSTEIPGNCLDKNTDNYPIGARHYDTSLSQCHNLCTAGDDCIAYTFDISDRSCRLYAMGPNGPYTHGSGIADRTCYIMPEGTILTLYKYVFRKFKHNY